MGLQKSAQDRRETRGKIEMWEELEALTGQECWEAIAGGGVPGAGRAGSETDGGWWTSWDLRGAAFGRRHGVGCMGQWRREHRVLEEKSQETERPESEGLGSYKQWQGLQGLERESANAWQ